MQTSDSIVGKYWFFYIEESDSATEADPTRECYSISVPPTGKTPQQQCIRAINVTSPQQPLRMKAIKSARVGW